MRTSIASELRFRYGLIGGAAFAGLFLFVLFDVDQVFDARYKELGISGLAYEIGDHVILPVIVLLLPIFVATPWVVRRSLTSLGLAARRIDEASGRDRGFRVTLSGLPMEAVPFASAVNDLLRRLDEAAERQEAFAADIAHELKTPLSVLALELERYGDPLARRIQPQMAAMNRLIDQLLLIAQLDADAAAPVGHDEVELEDVAREVVTRLAPLAIAEGRQIELEVVEATHVQGRREAVSAALRNLVENALRVTPKGERVIVSVGPGSRVSVRDGGPGLTKEKLAALCQRLSRADHASSGGAGLGLSIVSKILASHGGSLETCPDLRELTMAFPETSTKPVLQS